MYSFISPRFVWVVFFHIASWLLLTHTSSYEPLRINQLAAAIVIAYLVMTTFCFDLRVLGNPHIPAHLVGHILFFISLVVLVSRMYEQPASVDSNMDKLRAVTTWFAGPLGSVFTTLAEILAAPSIIFMLLIVIVSMLLPANRAVALYAIALVLMFAWILGSDFQDRQYALAGIICLFAAIGFQACSVKDLSFWRAVWESWKEDDSTRMEFELKYRLLQRMYGSSNGLSDRECVATIAKALRTRTKDPFARDATRQVIDRLVTSDGLAEIVTTPSGTRLFLRLPPTEPDAFNHIATTPRIIILASIALIWVILPVDAWPDFLPGGTIDDLGISSLAGYGIIRSIWGQAQSGRSPSSEAKASTVMAPTKSVS